MYWLSKNGYECVHVRHIGIDIIASKNGERMGISVKGRSRKVGEVNHRITINNPYSHLKKISKAKADFDCLEYFAFVLDQDGKIYGSLVPVSAILKFYNPEEKLSSQDWNTQKFVNEPGVLNFNLEWKTR